MPEPHQGLLNAAEAKAQLAGMPVAFCQGWLAGLTRTGEVSNSGAACAIQGRIALTRTSCGFKALTLRVKQIKIAQSTTV